MQDHPKTYPSLCVGDKPDFIIGLDPSYSGFGLSIFDVKENHFDFYTLKSDFKGEFNFISFFNRVQYLKKEVISLLPTSDNIWIVTETPVPQGHSSPILYMLCGIILDSLVSRTKRVFIASSKRIQSLTCQSTVNGRQTIYRTSLLVDKNNFGIKRRLTSSHEADAVILSLWIIHNLLSNIKTFDLPLDKWKYSFSSSDNFLFS